MRRNDARKDWEVPAIECHSAGTAATPRAALTGWRTVRGWQVVETGSQGQPVIPAGSKAWLWYDNSGNESRVQESCEIWRQQWPARKKRRRVWWSGHVHSNTLTARTRLELPA